MWQIDLGWLPCALQSCPTPPLPSWTEYNQRLLARDKDRERPLTCYCHRQNRLVMGKLIEFIVNQIRVGQ